MIENDVDDEVIRLQEIEERRSKNEMKFKIGFGIALILFAYGIYKSEKK